MNCNKKIPQVAVTISQPNNNHLTTLHLNSAAVGPGRQEYPYLTADLSPKEPSNTQ